MALKTPLYNIHKKLGAKFTTFADFEMPMYFSSIKDEHLSVRKSVGLFDVSHMGNLLITGNDAEKLISLTTVEDASKIADGKSQYTVLLKENGTIIDDTIFLHLEDEFIMIPNAGMSNTVNKWLSDKAKKYNLKIKTKDLSTDYVIVAVQGPKSKETLQKLTKTDLNNVEFFGCRYIDICDVNCISISLNFESSALYI